MYRLPQIIKFIRQCSAEIFLSSQAWCWKKLRETSRGWRLKMKEKFSASYKKCYRAKKFKPPCLLRMTLPSPSPALPGRPPSYKFAGDHWEYISRRFEL